MRQASAEEMESPLLSSTMTVPAWLQSLEHLEGGHVGVPDTEQQSMLSRTRCQPGQLEDAAAQKPVYRVPERFDWFHVPHCAPNWIPPIMERLSSRKGSTKLYSKFLGDPVWLEHYNNPAHDSFSGHFVLPHAQVLLPTHLHSTDEMLAPWSANEQVQFALYLPYL